MQRFDYSTNQDTTIPDLLSFIFNNPKKSAEKAAQLAYEFSPLYAITAAQNAKQNLNQGNNALATIDTLEGILSMIPLAGRTISKPLGKAAREVVEDKNKDLLGALEPKNQNDLLSNISNDKADQIAKLRAEANAQRFGEGWDIQPPTDTNSGLIVFHGSGEDFNKFRLDKIGTGEGNQAFGHGLYFSDLEDVGNFYKKTVEMNNAIRGRIRFKYKGKEFVDLGDTPAAEAASPEYQVLVKLKEEMAGYLPANPKLATPEESKKRLLARLDNEIERYSKAGSVNSDVGSIITASGESLEELILASYKREREALLKLDPSQIEVSTGKTYKVKLDVKAEDLLDYDLSIGNQTEEIKSKIAKLVDKELTTDDMVNFGYDPTETGAMNRLKESLLSENRTVVSFLNDFAAVKGKDNAAEELLNKYGIKGIRYLEGGSRNVSGGRLLDIEKISDGNFQARIVLDNSTRQTGLGGSGRVITKKQGFKNEEEAKDWVNSKINKKDSNYVIFDEDLINILAKYGIVGGVGVTALANTDITER